MATSRRAAFYVRVSTADRGQTVENQLQPLHEAAERLGWTVVAIHKDEGISGAKGRDHRPGLDALLRGVTRREYDIAAAWSVCRLGRSLADLIGFLGELQARRVDLYLQPTGARYQHAIGPDVVWDVVGVQRVRTGDDPGQGAGWSASSQIVGYPPWPTTNIADQDRPHPAGIG